MGIMAGSDNSGKSSPTGAGAGGFGGAAGNAFAATEAAEIPNNAFKSERLSMAKPS